MMVEQEAADKAPVDLETFWSETLMLIRTRVNDFVFNAFFKPLRARSLDESTLRLEIHDQFTRDWIEDHYRYVIDEALGEYATQASWAAPKAFSLTVKPDLVDPRQNAQPAQEVTVR